MNTILLILCLSLIHISNLFSKNGTFIAEDGTDLLALFKEKYYSDDHSAVSYTHLDVYKRQDVYTGGSSSVGYVRNTDREKQYARSVVN